jgi:hypothetical protein
MRSTGSLHDRHDRDDKEGPMQVTPRNVEYLKEMLRPSNWDRLTSEEKHRLFELITEEMVLKDIRKTLKRVKNERKQPERTAL